MPTSRATRVTSEAKVESWSTIVLIVFFSSRISPLALTVICLDRSPFATAVVTSAILRTWSVSVPAMKLTLSVKSFHVPDTSLTSACPPRIPSVRNLARDARNLGGEVAQLIDHRIDRALQLQNLALRVDGNRLATRSPFATAVVTSAMFRT